MRGTGSGVARGRDGVGAAVVPPAMSSWPGAGEARPEPFLEKKASGCGDEGVGNPRARRCGRRLRFIWLSCRARRRRKLCRWRRW